MECVCHSVFSGMPHLHIVVSVVYSVGWLVQQEDASWHSLLVNVCRYIVDNLIQVSLQNNGYFGFYGCRPISNNCLNILLFVSRHRNDRLMIMLSS